MTASTPSRSPFSPRRIRPVRTTRIVAVSATIALLLSACGDDASDVAAPVSTVTSVVADAPVAIKVAPSASNGGATGAPAEAPVGEDAMPTRLAWMEYVLGVDLPALDTDSPAWRLSAGEVDPARIAAVAAALGLTGDVVEQPADMGGGWTIGPVDGSGPSLNVSRDGMLSWWYSSGPGSATVGCAVPEVGTAVEPAVDPPAPTEPAATTDSVVVGSDGSTDAVEPIPVDPPIVDCVVPEPPVGVPTADEAEARLRDLLVGLGVDVDQLEFETYADEWNANVTAYLLLDGVRTPLVWGASFGGDGELLYANGTLATPERVADYPRIGSQAAFERLQNGGYWWGGALGAAAETVRGAATSDDSGIVSPGMPEPGSPIEVVITGVEEELWMLWDIDGTVWLVPGYAFTSDDGGRFSVPAIPDDLLDIQEPTPMPEPLPVDPMPVDSVPAGDTPVTDDPGAPADLPIEGGINALVGMTEQDATTAIELAGWTSRVVARDGEQFAVTMDLRMDRVNLEIVDGVVTAASIG